MAAIATSFCDEIAPGSPQQSASVTASRHSVLQSGPPRGCCLGGPKRSAERTARGTLAATIPCAVRPCEPGSGSAPCEQTSRRSRADLGPRWRRLGQRCIARVPLALHHAARCSRAVEGLEVGAVSGRVTDDLVVGGVAFVCAVGTAGPEPARAAALHAAVGRTRAAEHTIASDLLLRELRELLFRLARGRCAPKAERAGGATLVRLARGTLSDLAEPCLALGAGGTSCSTGLTELGAAVGVTPASLAARGPIRGRAEARAAGFPAGAVGGVVASEPAALELCCGWHTAPGVGDAVQRAGFDARFAEGGSARDRAARRAGHAMPRRGRRRLCRGRGRRRGQARGQRCRCSYR